MKRSVGEETGICEFTRGRNSQKKSEYLSKGSLYETQDFTFNLVHIVFIFCYFFLWLRPDDRPTAYY